MVCTWCQKHCNESDERNNQFLESIAYHKKSAVHIKSVKHEKYIHNPADAPIQCQTFNFVRKTVMLELNIGNHFGIIMGYVNQNLGKHTEMRVLIEHSQNT